MSIRYMSLTIHGTVSFSNVCICREAVSNLHTLVDLNLKDWKNISSKEREVYIRETYDGYMVCSAIKVSDGEYLGKFYLDQYQIIQQYQLFLFLLSLN